MANRILVPNAKTALNNMKFETAKELGVNLTDGYNGNLTAHQNGSVGGGMVRKMIASVEQNMR